MTQRRASGPLLYGAAALLLAGGASWWFSAAPEPTVDPRLAAGWTAVEKALPDREDMAGARTFVMYDTYDTQETQEVDQGGFQIYLMCAGAGTIHAQLTSTTDPGIPIPCTDPPTLVTTSSGLSGTFDMTLSAQVTGSVVVRWQLVRTSNY